MLKALAESGGRKAMQMVIVLHQATPPCCWRKGGLKISRLSPARAVVLDQTYLIEPRVRLAQ
jgi:hypothetical protein